MNSKHKGDLAVALAIANFAKLGYEILLPIGDKQPYDLVVDTGISLQKVQVKYAGKYEDGTNRAELRTHGGNRSGTTVKKYAEDSFDLLFIYAVDKGCYIIPWNNVSARGIITVSSAAYDQYLV
jgi:hypothetical protein